MHKLNPEKLKPSALLIELDALFDTRMSTLCSIDTEHASTAIKQGYHERPFDVFPGLEDKVFRDKYAARNKSTLKGALITPMAAFIKEFVVGTLDNVNNSPFHFEPVIIVNLYPYKLTDEETRTIIAGVRALTNGLATIEVINKSYEEITPLYVKLNLSVMILYEYDKWLEAQSQSGEWKVTCPDVTLIAPRIYMMKQDRLPKPDEEDPFELMMKGVGVFINLVLLPIDRFSLVLKMKQK